MMMPSAAMPLSLSLLAGVTCLTAVPEAPRPMPLQDVQAAVVQWMDEVSRKGSVFQATLRAADGVSPLPAKAITDRLFALQDGDLSIGIGFSQPPKKDTSLEEMRATLRHIALDRMPVPGVRMEGWETQLQTPRSSFRQGVSIESWKDGVLRVRVQTQFFAINARRTDILVPADAAMPKASFFQIRRPIRADLRIEGRLFPAEEKVPAR